MTGMGFLGNCQYGQYSFDNRQIPSFLCLINQFKVFTRGLAFKTDFLGI